MVKRNQAQFNMRLDRPLLRELQKAAKDQDRSVNSEMVYRLEQSFARDTTHDRLGTIMGKINQLLEGQRVLSAGLLNTREETDQEQQARMRADLRRWRKEDEQEPELPLQGAKGEKP